MPPFQIYAPTLFNEDISCHFILLSVQSLEFCFKQLSWIWLEPMQNTESYATLVQHPLNNSPVSVPFTLATAMNLLPKFCLEAPAIHDSLTSMYFKDLLTAICKTCFNLSNDFIFVQTAHSISQNKCSEP